MAYVFYDSNTSDPHFVMLQTQDFLRKGIFFLFIYTIRMPLAIGSLFLSKTLYNKFYELFSYEIVSFAYGFIKTFLIDLRLSNMTVKTLIDSLNLLILMSFFVYLFYLNFPVNTHSRFLHLYFIPLFQQLLCFLFSLGIELRYQKAHRRLARRAKRFFKYSFVLISSLLILIISYKHDSFKWPCLNFTLTLTTYNVCQSFLETSFNLSGFIQCILFIFLVLHCTIYAFVLLFANDFTI